MVSLKPPDSYRTLVTIMFQTLVNVRYWRFETSLWCPMNKNTTDEDQVCVLLELYILDDLSLLLLIVHNYIFYTGLSTNIVYLDIQNLFVILHYEN